jgi:shikimate 5-dehydrogenase
MKSTITGKTQLISLMGSPVSHSRSPNMQNGVFEALGLDFVYVAFDVNLEGLEAAIQGMRSMKFRGGNVTMPLKKAVCQYLDRLTPAAEMAGAVNVIVNDPSVIPDVSYFHPDLVVSDLIYVPVETQLLKMAKSVGNKTVSGLGMQLFQGVSAFKMWTGHDMPIQIAREILFGKPQNAH